MVETAETTTISENSYCRNDPGKMALIDLDAGDLEFCQMHYESGQIIATSHDLGPQMVV